MANPIDAGHSPDTALLALLHEQPFDGALASRTHVEGCPSCSARFRELAAEDRAIAALLAELDHPAPTDLALPLAMRSHRRLRRGGLAAAAAILLGTATLAALPASPLHRMLFGTGDAPAARAGGATAATPKPALASGIAIPGGANLEIRFLRGQGEGLLELRRVPGTDVALRSRGGSTAYDVTDGAVVVDNIVPAAAYLIDLPAVVRRVHVTVGNRTVLRWPADSARGVTTDADGTIRVPLTASPEVP